MSFVRIQKNVVLQRIEIEDERQFFSHLKTKVDQGSSNAAFVFIHGYNVQFDDALRRTAQIKKDLDFDGPAILIAGPPMVTCFPTSAMETTLLGR